ncbi:long-chain-fatty-acid--CoA ligase [Ferviditalea candida]|uniref:Long-chain fatty acid--CoA ligase n=1 Tax=Ferviditalea candida TaxID=3108399 RepID=A0ABU5ZGJ6_9BACL|nr:long-chain fatty acid--CoA ligase [Paenibacillaceae bacterium T2]
MADTRIWHQHYPKEVPFHCDYPKQNLACILTNSAERYPGHPAIEFFGKKWTYKQLAEQSSRFANALIALGIHKGDRVAVMLPNCPQAVISYYGILMAGAVVVETNPLYTERELEHHFADSGAVAVITLDVLLQKVRAVKPKTHVRHILVTSIVDFLPFPKNIVYRFKQKKDGSLPNITYNQKILSVSALLKSAEARPVIADVDADNDIAILQYTGGTTGRSKGVMLTHANITVNTIQASVWSYTLEQGKERFLGALPLFHVFGMTVLLNMCFYMGGMLILMPRYDVNQLLKLIGKWQPTFFPGAPTMFIGILNHPELGRYDLRSVKYCISGSAPLPAEVQERFEKLTGGQIIEGYGLTEASPITHCNVAWGKRKIGSIGIPFPDTEAKIVDLQTGEELSVGAVGELAVKGPQVMKGYWNNEEETGKALKDGWLLTGDMAMMDEDGFFFIMDRKKDMIIAGGFNIYPREVEEVLYEHPGVMDASVIGIPDSYRGETVKAFVVAKPGITLFSEELDEWCRERLAAYKVPRYYEFRHELPKTMVGKVLRRKLLEEEMDKIYKA